MAIRLDEFEEVIEVVVTDVGMEEFFALAVHEADVHLMGVQVDSAVEFRCRSVVFHNCSISWLIGVLRTPVNVNRYAGSVGSTPRPVLDDTKTNKGFAEFHNQSSQPTRDAV
jgi:hypothetical protein